MKRIDIIIVAVLVVAVLFSAMGLATYERAGGLQTFDVAWSTQTATVTGEAQSRNGNGEVTVNVPIEIDNLTYVNLTVMISGPGPRGQPVTASVTLTPPGMPEQRGSATLPGPGAQSTQNVPFSVPVHGVPTNATVDGADRDAAQERLSADFRNSQARGAWVIKVTFAGAAPNPLTGGEQFTVSATGEAKSYSAEARPRTPDVGR